MFLNMEWCANVAGLVRHQQRSLRGLKNNERTMAHSVAPARLDLLPCVRLKVAHGYTVCRKESSALCVLAQTTTFVSVRNVGTTASSRALDIQIIASFLWALRIDERIFQGRPKAQSSLTRTCPDRDLCYSDGVAGSPSQRTEGQVPGAVRRAARPSQAKGPMECSRIRTTESSLGPQPAGETRTS